MEVSILDYMLYDSEKSLSIWKPFGVRILSKINDMTSFFWKFLLLMIYAVTMICFIIQWIGLLVERWLEPYVLGL